MKWSERGAIFHETYAKRMGTFSIKRGIYKKVIRVWTSGRTLPFETLLSSPHPPVLGLSTSCSRFPKKLPVISQNVAQKLLKKSQKLLFVTKVAQRFLLTIFCCCCCCSLPLFGLMQKYANCTTKVRFLLSLCNFAT